VTLRHSLLLLLVGLSSGCATLTRFFSSSDEPLYATDADENFKKGVEAMESTNYQEAARYFDYTRTKFPFLEVSKAAELKLADLAWVQEKFTEARDRYQNFVRLHPTHPRVDYAAFRAASTHFRDIPSDFFLLPPAIEKDQLELKGASTALGEFVRLYPKSEFVPEAKTTIADVKRRLARHELYVAEFYRRRDKWPAVVNRLSIVQQNFSGIGFDADVAFGLYDAHLALQQPEKARDALAFFVTTFPNDDQARKARAMLDRLSAASPVQGPPGSSPLKTQ